jgi:hypothetical protein
MSPTSQPTGSPTATPVRSNVIKTSRPTPSPTRKPTLCPSSLPTSRPSLTTETYLEDQLLDLIVNYTNADYSQVFYGEVGDRTSYTEGTCTSMVTSIGSASNLLQSSMYVASVALASSTYGSGIISNYNCSVKSTASTIVNSLISPTTSVVSTSCGGHTWKAKKCSTTSKLAFCVDCSDPCSTLCPSRNTFSVCSTPISCSGSSNEPFVQLLTVSLLPTVSPPTISSTSYTVTTSSISMSVSLSSGGTINVAIFSSGSSVRSVNDVLVQNIIYTVADSSSVAKIFFGSLSAAKSYDVYILTSSVTGAMMTTSQVTATKQTITTACCRPVAVGLSVVSLFQTRQGVSDVSVTAATRPDTNITVSLYLKHSESGNITHLLPSAVLFSANLKTALSQSLSISSLSTVSSGSLVLFANISGPDAAKYSVFYGTRTLKVIGLNEQPPTPVFSSAVFSNDGSKLLLGFNSATNKAGILSTAFTCSKLFSFTGVSAATCQWVSSSLVSAQLGPTATLVPGSSVSIASTASLTAACSTGDCSKWNKTAVTTLTISAPPLTLYPVVVVSAPSMVSTCAQLKLDWSASTGSAGRSWTANITAYGDVPASNLTTLNAYLQKIITSSGPLIIDRSYLPRGSYQFVVSLCNFLSGCSTGSAVVHVVSTSVPVAAIVGSTVVSMNKGTKLTINSDGYAPNCDGSKRRTDISYKWTVYQQSSPNFVLKSSSILASAFVLPAYSLTVNTAYKFVVTVTDSQALTSATSSVAVTVVQSNIIATIAGGTMRGVKYSGSITFDASASYDVDQPGVYGSAAGLSYLWGCSTLTPSVSAVCAYTVTSSQNSLSTYTLYAGDSSINSTGSVSVTVYDSTRTASYAVTLATLSASAPVLSVSYSGIKPNPTARILIASTVVTDTVASCKWSLNDTGIDLTTAALTSPTASYAPTVAGSQYTYNLLLNPNSLSAGTTYAFQLTCKVVTGASGTGLVVITTNGPPLPGSFSINPNTGTELQTAYTFLAAQWIDSDVPITYAFGFSKGGSSQLVQSQSQLSYVSSQLPAGLDVYGYNLTCVAIIYDSLNANASASYSVHVGPYAGSLSDMSAAIASNIQNGLGGTPDQARQAISAGGASMNSVSCLSAPNCTALYRFACQSTSNTCGSCFGGYAGDMGDANTICVKSSSSRRRRLTSSCSEDTDCGSWESCSGGTCILESKPCQSACNSNGTCTYQLISNGATIGDCKNGDSSCRAVCSCYDGHGGPSCALTTADLESKMGVRLLLLDGLKNLTQQENVDELTIVSWISNLLLICNAPTEMSLDALETASYLAQHFLDLSVTYGVSSDSVSSLLGVVDSIGYAIQLLGVDSTTSSDSRRKLWDIPTIPTWSSSIKQMVESYAKLVLSELVAGQYDVSVTQSTYRILLTSTSVTSSGIRNISLSAPLTAIETLNSVEATIFTIDVNGVAGNSYNFGLAVINAAAFGSGAAAVFNANPVLVLTDSTACSAGNCTAYLQVPNSVSESYASTDTGESFNATCVKDHVSSVSHNCSNGYIATTVCNGTFQGVVTSYCPYEEFVPACVSLSDDDTYSQQCQLDTYSGSLTSCECSSSSSTRRRLATNWTSSMSGSGLQVVTVTATNVVTPASSMISSPVGSSTAFPTLFPTASPTAAPIGSSHHKSNHLSRTTVICLSIFMPVAAALLVWLLFYWRSRHTGNKIKYGNEETDDELAKVKEILSTPPNPYAPSGGVTSDKSVANIQLELDDAHVTNNAIRKVLSLPSRKLPTRASQLFEENKSGKLRQADVNYLGRLLKEVALENERFQEVVKASKFQEEVSDFLIRTKSEKGSSLVLAETGNSGVLLGSDAPMQLYPNPLALNGTSDEFVPDDDAEADSPVNAMKIAPGDMVDPDAEDRIFGSIDKDDDRHPMGM